MKITDNAKFYIGCGFLAILEIAIILTFAFTSHAQDQQGYVYFPMEQNYNNFDFSTIVDVANSNNVPFDDYTRYLIIAQNWQGFYDCYIILSDGFCFGEINSDTYTFNVYNLADTGHWKMYQMETGFDGSWSNCWERDYLPSGNYSSLYANSWDYVSNYQVYSSNNYDNATLILNYKATPPWLVTDPDPFEPDPTDNPNNPPVKPTWDTNKTPIENIAELIKWLGDTVIYLFNNLKENFTNWFSALKKTIENVITTLYENLKSLFLPFIDSVINFLSNISDFFSYLLEPLDTTQITWAFEGSDFYGIYEEFKDFMDDFEAVLDIPEPNSFIIRIKLSDVVLGNATLQDYYLNLGDNILPFRNVFRTFIWVMSVCGLVILVGSSLPDWLKGSSGSNGGKDTK